MSHQTPHREMRGDPEPGGAPGRLGAGRFSAASLAGQHGRINQDSHACRAPDFFAVADGVGGGSLGEVASAMLVRQLGSLQAPQPDEVAAVLQAADQAIAQRIAEQGSGPGAAVCAAVWSLDASSAKWLAMTVGDCQVMVLVHRDGAWQARWASTAQTYAAAGLQPPPGVPPHAPANMVGCGMACPAQFDVLCLAPGERLLLCSDGFDPTLIEQDGPCGWRTNPSPLSLETAERWCEQMQRAGARDDVTVILVEPAMLAALPETRWPWGLLGLAMFALAALGPVPWGWR